MSFFSLGLLLPFILALHNAEEFSRYDEFVRVLQGGGGARFVTRRVVRDAMILITLLAAALSVLTFTCRTHIFIRISETAVFALMINSLGHGVASARQRALTPGTLSAIALVLPYCLLTIATIRTSFGESWVSLLALAAAGAAVMPVAVAPCLAAAYGLSRLQGRQLPT